MIKSMTGFGKSRVEAGNKKIGIEVRSLNSKQLDLNLRLPGIYRDKENALRLELSSSLVRGKVDVLVFIEENIQQEAPASINIELAKVYKRELEALAKEIGEHTVSSYLPLILKMPDVLKTEYKEPEEGEWKEVVKGIYDAIEDFNKFRKDEGNSLSKDLEQRINIISQRLKDIEAPDNERVKNIKDRIKNNLMEVLPESKIDHNRLEEEMIYYIEKLDITEEKTRLRTHCEYFLKTMNEEGAGRKLGFITQEIGREINTIGSKANNAAIQKMVVEMKDELEKIKEQTLNIL